jgi:hypothetical protein
MRLRTAAATVFATAILLGGAASTASAGEINGNDEPTQGPAHANSICVFSGLEDGEEFGQPAGPGAPPQSWGQIPKEVRDVLATEGAHPGDSCNGHTGFLAGGGEE